MNRFDYIADPVQRGLTEAVAIEWERITGTKYDGGCLILRPKNMATIKEPSEDQIQSDFFSWLALHEKKYPELALFYSIPNGSHKSPAARGLFKRTGLKSGVPDVHSPIGRGCYIAEEWEYCIGLWIEFKSKKGVLSDSQKAWHDNLRSEKHLVEICRSWIEAANVTIDYLGLDIPKL
jgi:hypothetical protein